MKKIIDQVNKEFGKGEIWAIVCVFVLTVGLTIFPVLRTLSDEVRGITMYSDATGKTTRVSPIDAVNSDAGKAINAARINLGVGVVSHGILADTGAYTHTQIDGHIDATGTSVHGLGSAATHADTEYEDAGAVSGHESTYNHANYDTAYSKVNADSASWDAKQSALTSGGDGTAILDGVKIRSLKNSAGITWHVGGDSVRAEYGPDMSVIKDLSVGGNATITGSLVVDSPSLSVGSTPASTGTIRVRNNGSMKYRNATDNGDFDFLAWSSGTIDIGGVSSSTINITNNATDKLNLVTGPVVASSSVQGEGFLSSSTGSADVAGYAFSADTNTGINRTAADTLGIQVGGAIVAKFSSDSEYHSGDIKIGSTWATKTLNFCNSNWGIKTNSSNNSLDVFGYGANDATRQFRVTDHNGNNRFNVDFYSGNVGIGTEAPSVNFDVQKSAYSGCVRFGTIEAMGGLNNCWISDNTYLDAGWKARQAGYCSVIHFTNGGVVIKAGSAGSVAAGGDPIMTDAVAIQNTGNVIIGSSNAATVTANGNIYCPAARAYQSSGYTMKIDADGRMGRDSSARRYKDNIEPFAGNVFNILNAQAVQYTLKSDGSHDIGFIADDLDEKGCKELVGYDEGLPSYVKYERITMYHNEIIKNLLKRIEALEAK